MPQNNSLRVVVALAFAFSGAAHATNLQSGDGRTRVEIDRGAGETIALQEGGQWLPGISAASAATRVVTVDGVVHTCAVQNVGQDADTLVVRGDCEVGKFEQRWSSDSEALSVLVRYTPSQGVEIESVEDRYEFSPARRESDTPTQGPLDFVWSQNIKSEAGDLIPQWEFKSPAVMFQQGRTFAAILPALSDRQPQPLALDLDVTSGNKPWFSYGVVASEPHGHSYFRRVHGKPLQLFAGAVEYQYKLMVSSEPEKLGYRRVVHELWQKSGREELLRSNDLQQNILRKRLLTFNDWRQDTWIRYADDIYRDFDCDGKRCGTLMSSRNPGGEWDKQVPDAWFNAWFQTLRSAYGWYLYGAQTSNPTIQKKAESVLNLALHSPQDHGVFPTIYLLDEKRWIRGDGWAGFADHYHTFSMSWTAYWLLQWSTLLPERKDEILAFTRAYGDFLLQQQLPSGVIPSWYNKDLEPRPEFKYFNAETSASALFLASLFEATHDSKYLDAAKKAMEFVTREVLPRQRWYDYETFLSCARKPFDFYDRWTAQYPQNNMSTIQAASAYLKLYEVTKDSGYLDRGTQVLDYLLLTQQVWNNPAFTPKLVGGFTTQNTDAEWSDARECYAAVLLFDYYRATRNAEYLERAVAAARSIFGVAPWENWAHTGHVDEPGALTGFHWGPGSGLTSVEIMARTLGDAFIDLDARKGVGFNACRVTHVVVEGNEISFDMDAAKPARSFKVRFSVAEPQKMYRVRCNGREVGSLPGGKLVRDGIDIQLSSDSSR